jgi:putative nucleotidyltransferase with HDIG domain
MKKYSRQFFMYFFVIVIVALYLLFYSMTSINLGDIRSPGGILLFTGLLIFAQQLPVPLPEKAEVTVDFAIVLSSLLIFGTKTSILMVFLSSLITEIKRIKIMSFYKAVFNISLYVVMAGVGGFVFEKLGGIPGEINLYRDLQGIMVLTFTYLFVNVCLVTVALSLIEKEPVSRIFFNNFKWALPNYLALAPLGILLAIIFLNIGALGILLFLVPLLVARHSFKLYMDMRKVYLDTIQALATALEAKDPYTRGHSERVARYSSIIAEEMNLPQDVINNLNFAALLHDIGKIGIPETILNKPGKLSEDEFSKIKTHPILGASIVEKIDFLARASSFIKFHHEKQNGSGYPAGLQGEEIPLGAAILAVADAFDALTSDRPYRKAWSVEETLIEIERNSNIQFKPEVVDALKSAVKKGRIKVNAD